MTLIFMILFFATKTYADQSDFLSLCKTISKEDPIRLQTCEGIHKQFFKGTTAKDPSVTTSPKELKANEMSVDKKILFMVLNDPNYLPSLVYCYSVYNHWINPEQISPDTLGTLSSGVSILNENLAAYQKWLNTEKIGKACRTLVEKESQLPVTNLADSLKGYTAMIVLNPYAVVQKNGVDFDSAMNELRLTMNHERVHAYHVLCPQFEKSEKEKWLKLTSAEKNSFMQKFPNYNWNDLKTAGREYSAFSLETKPEDLAVLVKSCPIK